MRTFFAADRLVLPLIAEDPALETLDKHDGNLGIAALVIRMLPVGEDHGERADREITNIVLVGETLDLHVVHRVAVRAKGD